jgi:hypothetical protein
MKLTTGLGVALAASLCASFTRADEQAASTPQNPPLVERITCSSNLGETQHCPADTSAGVVLGKSTGSAPCLLGKTWGYDDTSIWVSDGCSAIFVAGTAVHEAREKYTEKKAPEHVPNVGFKLYDGDKGQIYMRLFSYVRYLNQKGLDPTYVDSFGNSKTVPQRQDVQLNKFFLPFSGWFLTPKLRYYLYVWSANTAQGDPAQVVGGGNLSFTFNRYFTFGGGITSLPSVRSTEGQFPYWLSVDARIISDEFFRGSYTTGFWLKGQLAAGLNYMAMIANNLSTLGVSASQLDNGFNTTSFSLVWQPTTKEFGPWGGFGDYESHEKLATRLGAHYTRSIEDKQSQSDPNSIENSQIRLTDGSIIFTRDLFGAGINVNKVTYEMVSVDGGAKYKGLSLDAEYYWRFLHDFQGDNVGGIANINDHGYQIQASAMPVPKILQVYLGGGEIKGVYGDGSEFRLGANLFPLKSRGLRWNAEWLHLNKCPVGYTAVPYPVGGNGNVFHTDFEMNF